MATSSLLPADLLGVVEATFPAVRDGAQAYATLLRHELRDQSPTAVVALLRAELPEALCRLGLTDAQCVSLVQATAPLHDAPGELDALLLLAGVVATCEDVVEPLPTPARRGAWPTAGMRSSSAAGEAPCA